MYLNLKKITAIFLSVLMLFLIVACNENPKTESETESKTESSEPVNTHFNIADEDDTTDPENIENAQLEDGAKVNFAEVQDKKGLQNGIDVSKWQGKIDWQKV